MRYYANCSVNNGDTLSYALEGNNKRKLMKEIRDFAEALCFYGNIARWWVEDATGKPIAQGRSYVYGNKIKRVREKL